MITNPDQRPTNPDQRLWNKISMERDFDFIDVKLEKK